MKRNKNTFIIVVILFVLFVDIIGIFVGVKFDKNVKSAQIKAASSENQSSLNLTKSSKSVNRLQIPQNSTATSSTSLTASSVSDLPQSHQSDWDLVLVNRNNPKPEMNPTLTNVGDVQVDSRIAVAVQNFLAAAQKISPAEHLISGYRSVAYQTQLYEMYIEQEMEGNGTVNKTGQAISRAEAIKDVQTYSQPPECSEHETGLAIDMSSVDSLNSQNPSITQQIAAISSNYGFVLRFQSWGTASTGVDSEDWHYRYVGVANAEYMTKHHLTLEQFLQLLPK